MVFRLCQKHAETPNFTLENLLQAAPKKEASRRRPSKSSTGGYREFWKAKRPRVSFRGMQMDVCSACEEPAGPEGGSTDATW